MKKAHPMEERHLRRKGSGGGWIQRNTGCPEMSMDEMILAIKRCYVQGGYSWEYIPFTREHCNNTYKNGAKMYDKAMQFLNSPLMRALE